MNEVVGTSACHCCGAWNSIIHYANGEDEWSCSNGCQELPDAKYTVITGGSGAPVAYRDPEGSITAKNSSHACHIWRVSARRAAQWDEDVIAGFQTLYSSEMGLLVPGACENRNWA